MMVVDVVVETLIIEGDRAEHISRHDIILEEVVQVVSRDYVYIQGKNERWILIGKTNKNRFLSIVVGKRIQKNTYGLVTARPSRKEEKSFYHEFILEGGEEND